MSVRLHIAFVCVASLFAGSASADEGAAGGSHLDLRLGTQYDSNVFFVARNEVASASAVAELASGYRWQGELTGIDLALNARYQPYEDSNLSAASALEMAATIDREHEYGSTRARVAYRDESALINAFDNQGRFVGDSREQTASASLRRVFEISESETFVALLDGSRVTFVDTPPDSQQDDYDFATGTGQWEWQISERMTFGAGIVGSWYSSDGRRFSNEVTTAGPAVTMRYELDETMSGFVDLSYRLSDSQVVYLGSISDSDSGSNYYGRAGITKRFERGNASFEAGRTVQPGSSGRQETRDQIAVAFARELTERGTLHVGATALSSTADGQGSVATADDRRHAFAGDIGIDYELSEHVTVTGGYRYLWQNTDAQDTDAHGQTVSMTLRWVLGGAAS